MKIQSVKIINFRNIRNLEKEINGSNIILLGENTVGKSNFMKAIEICLGVPDVAGVDQVTHGEHEAKIEVVTNEKGEEYKFEVKFKEGSDKPYIKVTAPDGLTSNAKSTIGKIVGEIEFDIYKFVEMSDTAKGRKEQVEIVKSFFPQEIKDALFKYEHHIETMFADRTENNRELKTINGFLAESDVKPEDIQKYVAKNDAAQLVVELNEMTAHNAYYDKAAAAIEQIDKDYDKNAQRIQELQKQIETILAENTALSNRKTEGKKWLEENPRKDTADQQKKVMDVNQHNAMVDKVAHYNKLALRKLEYEGEVENLTVKIESERQLIQDTVRDMEDSFPVKGLSFENDQLIYNGHPVDKSTMSTSEIMMLGAKLKMAKNPNARVLFIEHGESLGTEKLAELQAMAHEYDFQIFLEQVQRGTEELVIEILPDVEGVKGDDAK